MDPALVLDWSREALRVALLLGAPALAAALVVALVVGALQTMTQMHEPVLGLVPRLVAVLVAVLAVLPWLLDTWVTFAVRVMGSAFGSGPGS
jgi:flagellar biosynthesis protein FliQ